jgi:RHS repeat-associated protein
MQVLLLLLGLGGADRAAAQVCGPVLMDALSRDSSSSSTRTAPPRRLPSDGETVVAADPGCITDEMPPVVEITPMSSNGTPVVQVTIDWVDNVALDQYSRRIYLNGEDVTGDFDYTAFSVRSARSVGNVVLRPGPNTFLAEIWDQAWHSYSRQTTYVNPASFPTSCPVGQFLGTYYGDIALAGDPVHVVCEDRVDHDWGNGSGSGTVGGDFFSVRWVGRHLFREGTYRFTVRADDGVRLYVDGQLVIDRWVDQPATTYTVDRVMSAGEHEVKLEYYERAFDAVAQLSWNVQAPPPPPATAGAVPSLRDVVSGLYHQVLERGPTGAEHDHWMARLGGMTATVAEAAKELVQSAEYSARFIDGRTQRLGVAQAYRHVLAREASGDELAAWEPSMSPTGVFTSMTGAAIAAQLIDGVEYRERFGPHAVPGAPVTLWDARRANLVLEPGLSSAESERSLCLTVAVPGGAYECGDLRLAHALPAARSINKARQPVLVYSSQAAHPVPVFAARLMLPPSTSALSRVRAVLRVGPTPEQLVERVRRDWTDPSAFPMGQARRIALSFDAATDATGLYHFALEVTATYADGSTRDWVQRGTRALVNRRGSPFGAGWWLAGLEQLVRTVEGGLLWVGGDGSTRMYETVAPPTSGMPPEGVYIDPAPGDGPPPARWNEIWVARTADRGTDTLRSVGHELVLEPVEPTGPYTPGVIRTVPGGAWVHFDILGRHVATVNRLEHHTAFVYDDARLTELRVPLATGYDPPRVAYRFHYGPGGPQGRLYSVQAPDLNDQPTRTVVLAPHNGDPRVWSITDPDGKHTALAYRDAARPAVVNQRTDRRARWGAHYSYGAGGLLEKVNMDMGVAGEGDDLITRFTPAESQGLAGAPADPSVVHTLVDGPRNDVNDHTRFWLDRFGAPWRIVDAGARETILTRSDPRFPALVTRSDGPMRADGTRPTHSATYTARGNLHSQTDWSTWRLISGAPVHATTWYEYENTAWPDFLTRVTLPEGEVTRMGYHANGNRAWQQPGDDASRKVGFRYTALGLVEYVDLPAVNGAAASERYAYDARGNLEYAYTPRGFQTRMYNDVLGRTYRTDTPIDSVRVMVQENAFKPNTDLVELATTTGPGMNEVGQQTVAVRTAYDDIGNVRSVARWSTPEANPSSPIGEITTHFRYDPAGRRVAEVSPDAKLDSTVYDAAGNAIRSITRRGDTLTTEYDALNRPTHRRRWATRYDAIRDGIPSLKALTNCPLEPGDFTDSHAYPQYPTSTVDCSYTVPGDMSELAYDEVGNLVRADNSDAWVRRGYNLNGTLAWDSLFVRTVNGAPASAASFRAHGYGIQHEYDLNGRRTRLAHPGQLAGGTTGETRYTYNRVTGEPETVTDPLSNQFRYRYDTRGQLEEMQLPGARWAYGYDADGHLERSTLFAPGVVPASPISDMRYGYDQRGKMTSSSNLTMDQGTTTAAYSGLGHLVGETRTSQGLDQADQVVTQNSASSFRYDALGNVHRTINGTNSLGTAPTPLLPLLSRRVPSSSGTTGGVSEYQPGTGRLLSTGSGENSTHYRYDDAGNQLFQWSTGPTESFPRTDRAFWYGSDGLLRITEVREKKTPLGEVSGTWEEYRYDALGRRVWVRTRKFCPEEWTDRECGFGTVQRTVWDGDQVLHEIRAALADGENDGTPASIRNLNGDGWDPHIQLGRVMLTHGLGIDQPVSAIRMEYRADGLYPVPAFSWIPLWDGRGRAPYAIFGNNGTRTQTAAGGDLTAYWLLAETAYGPRNNAAVYRANGNQVLWMGSVMEDQQDASGLLYRRNRYYDPGSARFTQEDPIGLAGGLNLYGFANGDPVGYSDPYGLRADTLKAHDQGGEQFIGGTAFVASLAAGSADERTAEAGRAILTVLRKLDAHPTHVVIGVNDEGRTGTGAFTDGTGREGIRVNPTERTRSNNAVRFAHELGHSYARVIFGATDVRNISQRQFQNEMSLRIENHMRVIYGCAPRPFHGTDRQAPACP